MHVPADPPAPHRGRARRQRRDDGPEPVARRADDVVRRRRLPVAHGPRGGVAVHAGRPARARCSTTRPPVPPRPGRTSLPEGVTLSTLGAEEWRASGAPAPR